MSDYLWRWDTDWFWCSGAFGVQNPVIRRLWPARYRRSDFYHRLISLDHRFKVAEKIDRIRRQPPRERVVQDVEIPLERTPAFLRWFAEQVAMSPVWLCPLMLREPAGAGRRTARLRAPASRLGQAVAAVPALARPGLRQRRLLGHRADHRRAGPTATSTGSSRRRWPSTPGTNRCTPTPTTTGRPSPRCTAVTVYAELKDRYDPGHRLTGLYEKAVGRR